MAKSKPQDKAKLLLELSKLKDPRAKEMIEVLKAGEELTDTAIRLIGEMK